MNNPLEISRRRALARCDDREAVDALRLVGACRLDNRLIVEQIVDLAARVPAGRLRAELAVLPAFATSAADNRAQINLVAAEMLSQPVRALLQLIDIHRKKCMQIISAVQSSSRNNLVSQCQTVHVKTSVSCNDAVNRNEISVGSVSAIVNLGYLVQLTIYELRTKNGRRGNTRGGRRHSCLFGYRTEIKASGLQLQEPCQPRCLHTS